MSTSGIDDKYRIALDEILRVTRNFSSDTLVGDGGFGMVHKGELTKNGQTRTVAIKRLNRDGCQGNNEFRNELDMISSFHHPNIIKFIGYCDDPTEMIIVSDYAENGSLDRLLQKPDKMSSLTWAQRLQICLGAAKGLNYLHWGLGEHNRVIHRDVKSANILLDDKQEAKICDFGLSRLGARNQEDTQLLTRAAGTRYYIDPLYAERNRLTKESDVYSFGVVMFELSSGRLVYHPKCFGEDDKPQFLIDVVRSCYDDDKKAARRDKLIDPILRDHIDKDSFYMYNKIAHQCLRLKLEERPSMARIIQKIQEALNIQLTHQESPSTIITQSLDNFLIPLEEINSATQNFNRETCIGYYRYGVNHRGQFYGRWQNRNMIITRLNPKSYQLVNEFKKELQMISRVHHQNICPFIGGYCNEANERIIVHESVANVSLASYLNSHWPLCTSHNLTWAQRLKICLGAAKGLRYLHMVFGEDNEATCGNINSQNIFLDETMEAKISFFGLLRRGPTDYKPDKHISDIYSFGVIMFEMLSGCQASDLGHHVEPEKEMDIFLEYYHNNKLNQFIDPSIRDQIDSRCLNICKKIAYRCIERGATVPSGGDMRPPLTMDEVVERIEDAMDFEGIEN